MAPSLSAPTPHKVSTPSPKNEPSTSSPVSKPCHSQSPCTPASRFTSNWRHPEKVATCVLHQSPKPIIRHRGCHPDRSVAKMCHPDRSAAKWRDLLFFGSSGKECRNLPRRKSHSLRPIATSHNSR